MMNVLGLRLKCVGPLFQFHQISRKDIDVRTLKIGVNSLLLHMDPHQNLKRNYYSQKTFPIFPNLHLMKPIIY